jgi:hypothetical protein
MLLKELFINRLTDDDAMFLMAILHSCQIQLSAAILEGHPDLTIMEPITVNHAAEIISSLWKGIRDPRNNPLFWSEMWNGSWRGYARLEHVLSHEATRSQELRKLLESHSVVREVVPADWNPFVPD